MDTKIKGRFYLFAKIIGGLIGLLFILLLALALMADSKHPVLSASENKREFERLNSVLDIYEAKWHNAQIRNYEIYVEGPIVLSGTKICYLRATLIVKNSELVSVIEGAPKISVIELEKGCPYDHLFPDKMFEKVRLSLKTQNPNTDVVRVNFNQDFGYVTSFEVINGREGNVGCCTSIAFTDFHPTR